MTSIPCIGFSLSWWTTRDVPGHQGPAPLQQVRLLFQKLDVEDPDSANASFYSTQSAPTSQAGLRAASSTQSLARLGSPDDGNSTLFSLPGYRPTTRSSARRSQAGMSSGAPPGRGLWGPDTQT